MYSYDNVLPYSIGTIRQQLQSFYRQFILHAGIRTCAVNEDYVKEVCQNLIGSGYIVQLDVVTLVTVYADSYVYVRCGLPCGANMTFMVIRSDGSHMASPTAIIVEGMPADHLLIELPDSLGVGLERDFKEAILDDFDPEEDFEDYLRVCQADGLIGQVYVTPWSNLSNLDIGGVDISRSERTFFISFQGQLVSLPESRSMDAVSGAQFNFGAVYPAEIVGNHKFQIHPSVVPTLLEHKLPEVSFRHLFTPISADRLE